MKIDLEYLASILDVFINSAKSHVNLSELKKAGIALEGEPGKFNENLVFHMQIAIDNQLIASKAGPVFSIKDIGMHESINGSSSIIAQPIRLTQKGHDFACALHNKEVLVRLKSEFKDAPFKVIFDGGQKLLEHFMTKKLDDLLQ
ncbi:hypothetical protein D3C84_632090 [compost metagenome]